MFGINGWEFLLLAVIGLLILGPEKLPGFIADAGRMVRQVRRMATDARAEVVRELGPEFQDINLSDLDPRTFISKHLLDDELDLDIDLGADDAPTPPERAARRKSLDGAPRGKDAAGSGPPPSGGMTSGGMTSGGVTSGGVTGRGVEAAPAGGAEPPPVTSTGRHAAPPPPPPYDPDAT